MKEHTLTTEQFIDRDIDEVFAFFADAANLERLTPPWLNFRILTATPVEMRAGALIDYRIRLHGIPLRWRSEITAWEPPHRFVDEQVRGPYSRWIHEHTFEAVEGGTMVRDHIRYAAPGGPLVHRLFVAPDLEKVFRYREEQLASVFPPVQPALSQ